MAAADEEVEVEVAAAAEVLAAVAAACVPAAGSRLRGECHAVRAWGLGRAAASRGQAPAEARGRVVVKWLAPGRAAAVQLLGPDREAAVRAQEHGPAHRAAELRKVAPDPVAVCQGKAPARGNVRGLAEQAAISQAVVQRLAS